MNGITNFVIVKLKLKSFKIQLFKSQLKSEFKNLFQFSIGLYLIALAHLFIYKTDKIILGIFLAISAITYYQIAFVFINIIISINAMISSVFIPLVSEANGKENHDLLEKLKYMVPKYSAAALFPIIIIVFIYAQPIILFYMGDEYIHVATILRVFVIYWFVITLSPLGAMLLGLGKYKPVLKVHLIGVFINLTVSIIGVKLLGVIGVVLGTVFQYILVLPIQAHLFFKELRIPIRRFLKEVWLPIYISLFISLAVGLSLNYFFYPKSILSFLLQCFIIATFYYISFWYIGVKDDEKKYLIELIPIIKLK